MIYYKHIEIDNLEAIQSKTLDFLQTSVMRSTGLTILRWNDYIDRCPEVLTSLLKYNLYPTLAAVYMSYSGDASYIHADYKSPIHNQCRINIPILNCDGSKTEFYTGDKVAIVEQPNGLAYLRLNDEDAVKVDEVEISKPTVIRIQEPHRVVNNPDKNPRICLSLHTNIDPVFLLT